MSFLTLSLEQHFWLSLDQFSSTWPSIPFGGIARYTCKRGMSFESDPEMTKVEYECKPFSETEITKMKDLVNIKWEKMS